MFLRHALEDTILEVLEPSELWDPFKKEVLARSHSGEELQEPELYPKSKLIFPSGEALPQAWIDPHYES